MYLPEGAADPVTFRLAYNTTERPLPPGVDSPEVAEYTLTGAQGIFKIDICLGAVRFCCASAYSTSTTHV